MYLAACYDDVLLARSGLPLLGSPRITLQRHAELGSRLVQAG